MRVVYHNLIRFGFLVLLLLTACRGQMVVPTLLPTAVLPTADPSLLTPLPTLLPAAETAPAPLRTPAAPEVKVPAGRVQLSAQPDVPEAVTAVAQKIAQQHLTEYTWVAPEAADVLLTVRGGRPLTQWIFVPAAPFATIEDGLSLAELQAAWQADTPSVRPILVAAATYEAMAPLLGQPGTAVQIVPESELVTAVWQQAAYTIMPFDQLVPELKVLQLDGVSPLRKEFEAAKYPLQITTGVTGEAAAVAKFEQYWDGPDINYDPDKLTRVALTGVTALVRATAFNMEQNGILWPGEEVAPVLRQADIAHISNEVAFAPDCPYPNPVGGTTFCASEAYFALIEDLGTDVIELTGNHENDWGRDNFLYTLDKYEAAGLPYFGGGRNVQEAAEPVLFEHNGNKIAFAGCNSFGPTYAWATESAPGAMPCDGSLNTQIKQLRAEGYQVIATLQYTEFYQYAPTGQQALDFKALLEAGATAVSGSQGHHAQGFDFHNGGFIHYGLGNLFFDQMDQLGTRQTFVDTYVFYDGRLISVELWTGLIENYARPRQMTAAERAQVLTAVFQASGWALP